MIGPFMAFCGWTLIVFLLGAEWGGVKQWREGHRAGLRDATPPRRRKR